MVRDCATNAEQTRDPIKTRKKSKQEEKRRNSVSEITDYFNKSQMQMATPKASSTNRSKNDIKTTRPKDKSNSEATTEDEAINQEMGAEASSADCNQASNSSVNNSEDNSSNNMSKDGHVSTFKESATQTSEDLILKELAILRNEFKRLDQDLNDPKNGVSVQLAKTQDKVSNLHSDIHGAVNGLKTKMDSVTKTARDNAQKISAMEGSQSRMALLLDENKRLVEEIKIMQGLVHKVSQQSHHNADQILDITRRGMEQNLILHGVDDKTEQEFYKRKNKKGTQEFSSMKECCKYSAKFFFSEYLNVEVEISDIWKAHRTGPQKMGKVRPLIVKLSYAAKDLIMEHISALKGKKNEKTQQTLFIGEQAPDGFLEVRKQNAEKLKILKEANDKKPEPQRSKIMVINNKITIDGELYEPDVRPPLPSQLFPPSEKQIQLNELQHKLIETEQLVVKNSTFLALAAKVHSIQEVNDFYIAAAQRYPAADHIMAAYALKDGGKLKHGAVDDREYGAANKIRDAIFGTKAKNTVVFVVRIYGGLHMGYERFKAISKVAEDAIKILNES